MALDWLALSTRQRNLNHSRWQAAGDLAQIPFRQPCASATLLVVSVGAVVLSLHERPEICIAPDSADRLAALFRQDLRFRRAFVAGRFSVGEREPCAFCILHPSGGRFVVEAETVYVKRDEPGAGVGLDLVGLDSGRLAELEVFVSAGHAASVLVEVEAVPEEEAGPPGEVVPEAGPAPDADAGIRNEPSAARNVFERVRKLSLRERERVARQGQLAERMALERVYGGSVWEGLLQNPMLTVPEVAQIAKKGALPQPLVAAIVANNAWLASGEVRRALLGNPRVAGTQLDRVLRATPRPELKMIAALSPYRSQVRSAAKRMLDTSS
jgi:hypothetical protein